MQSENRKFVPYDITVDILSRLPVKSLIRFKLVCKEWFFIISHDSQFVEKHLLRAKQNSNFTHYRVRSYASDAIVLLPIPLKPYKSSLDVKYYFLYFPSSKDVDVNAKADALSNLLPLERRRVCFDTRAEILSSCNGLVLVGIGQNNLFLCNMSTTFYKRIPGNFSLSRNFVRMYGLGYDPSTCAYKVIRIVRVSSKGKAIKETKDPYIYGDYDWTSARVYNSKTNSWTRIFQEFPYKVFYDQRGLLVNNAIHWIVARDNIKEHVIIYFDLVEDKFKELEGPSYLIIDSTFYLEVTFQGLLSLRRENKASFWVMKEYDSKDSWTEVTIETCSNSHYPKNVFVEAEYIESLVSPYAEAELITKDKVLLKAFFPDIFFNSGL